MRRPDVDLVIKFGGAALGGPARIHLAARRVAELVRAGRVPVVVASAGGRGTDRLLAQLDRVAPAAPDPGVEPFEDTSDRRERDRLLATGEQATAALLALALLAEGVSARSLSGPEAGVGVLQGGRVTVDPAPVRELLDRGWVPVVAGFQGLDDRGELRTLGRGGSDLTAVVLAEALGAEECRLVKDVAGIHPPRPGAPGLPDLDASPRPSVAADALVALAAGGARVVQQEAAERARAAGVRLRIHHYRARALQPGGTVVEPEGALPARVGEGRTPRRRAS
jgi:aspartate kinase